jgi:hypothetical protein
MPQTSADAALSEEWLARSDQTLAFYRNLRESHVSDGRAVRKLHLPRFVNRRWMISGTQVGQAPISYLGRL